MGRTKAVGRDNITIKVWRGFGEEGIRWLTNLFNVILKTHKMPVEWRNNILIPLFKNKGDVQVCGNYRGINLLSHQMKLWERVMKRRIRQETMIRKNQFGFSQEGQPLRLIMLKYRELKKELHRVFINFEKAYDNISRRIIWDSLKARGISLMYIEAIRDIYDRISTKTQTPVGMTEPFPVKSRTASGFGTKSFHF